MLSTMNYTAWSGRGELDVMEISSSLLHWGTESSGWQMYSYCSFSSEINIHLVLRMRCFVNTSAVIREERLIMFNNIHVYNKDLNFFKTPNFSCVISASCQINKSENNILFTSQWFQLFLITYFLTIILLMCLNPPTSYSTKPKTN